MQSNKFVVTLCLRFYSKFHLIRLGFATGFFKHLMAPYLCMQVTVEYIHYMLVCTHLNFIMLCSNMVLKIFNFQKF